MATGLSSPFRGTGMRQLSMPKMSPQKQGFFNQIMGQAQPAVGDAVSQLSGIASGSPEMWQQLEAPAMRNFAGMQGSIASRFSGGGGMGQGQAAGSLRNSSGFQNMMGEAAAGLSEQLQSQRMGYQQHARDQLMSLFSQLMGQDEFDSFLTQKRKKQPMWKSLLGGALPIVGGGLGALGGPMGMALGSQIGAGLGGAFSGSGGGMDFSGIGGMPNKWRQ